MSTSRATPSPIVVVGLFELEAQARQAADALRQLNVADQQLGILAPGQRLSPSATPKADVSGLLAVSASVAESGDVSNVLISMGLPSGEARFYAEEARAGRTLLVVAADGNAESARDVVLQYGGYDVRSRGREMARAEGAGTPGGAGARPIDETGRWEDVRSRYEMLWQQHYGTTDQTWEQMEPIYRYAWDAANDPRQRGRRWSEVESALQRDWESLAPRPLSWSDALGPIRDVWEDVAEEATRGIEGGADRRIPRQGTDQSVAARDLNPNQDAA